MPGREVEKGVIPTKGAVQGGEGAALVHGNLYGKISPQRLLVISIFSLWWMIEVGSCHWFCNC
jgi:hypothetical protein